VKMQGKAAEEVKAKLVRKLDIEKIGGPLSQVIPTKRGEVVLVSRNEEQRKKLETVLKATEGIEMGLKKKLNPTVTLTGLETGWKEEEIVEEVFQKNGWIQSTSTMEEFKGAFMFLARKRCQVTEGEPDVRGGTTPPHCLHREADHGGADHGLRRGDGPGDTLLQLQRPGTHRQKLQAEAEMPQMRQGGSQDQGMQGREIGMRELQTDRAQSLRQEVSPAEEGARMEDRPTREVLNDGRKNTGRMSEKKEGSGGADLLRDRKKNRSQPVLQLSRLRPSEERLQAGIDVLQVWGSAHQEGLQGREDLSELCQRGTEGSESLTDGARCTNGSWRSSWAEQHATEPRRREQGRPGPKGNPG
jgi:hypothetical protein